MQIACLGWGSLIWSPQGLPIRGKWFEDGPFLPIEFARQSDNGRFTLVLVQNKTLVRSLWSILDCDAMPAAKEALAKRECIGKKKVNTDIGYWEKNAGSHGTCADIIAIWAQKNDFDGVVWTNLPPRFKDVDNRVPTAEEIVRELKSLPIHTRRLAEEYIKNAPPQIDTDYRREITLLLNWLPERK